MNPDWCIVFLLKTSAHPINCINCLWGVSGTNNKLSNIKLPDCFSKAVSKRRWWLNLKYNVLIKVCSSFSTLGPVTQDSVTQSFGKMTQPSVEQEVYEKVYFGKWLPWNLSSVPNHFWAFKSFAVWRPLDGTIKMPPMPSFKTALFITVSWTSSFPTQKKK